MKEYEERAVSLALNPAKLQDLTNRLKAARLTCPLFDTSRWVSNYFAEFNIGLYSRSKQKNTDGSLFDHKKFLICKLVIQMFCCVCADLVIGSSGEEFGARLLQDVEFVLRGPATSAFQSC